ncbi:MAG TPA: RtcB family protein [Planctomycetota bacterium]|nr:RtcB family protein [Planctomycetota bacterium]
MKRKPRKSKKSSRAPVARPARAKVRFERLDEFRLRIPREGGMNVDGIVYADERIERLLGEDEALGQVANVAHLPGIVGASLAMPDIHWGYGFPIGGVAAFDEERGGVVSPGGVGYDINCGCRLLQTNVARERLEGRSKDLADLLYRAIPSGVGASRKDFEIDEGKLRSIMTGGAPWLVEQGFGRERDLSFIEEGGKLAGAEPAQVSQRAFERGLGQLGTLGSGNHFVEVGWIDEVYDEETARALGLALGNVSVIIHTGSRGFGHQICTDFIEVMNAAVSRYKIELPDRQLCCAPLSSPEGKAYLAAMTCGINYAFANRQLITHWVRRAFSELLGRDDAELGLDVVYDVCHNIAKFEEHPVGNVTKRLCVHRKGATRAFPPGHPKTPRAYAKVGQPVLIPGDMGRYSYVLVGTEKAAHETWGSTCHGAGRVLSRGAAERAARGRDITRELAGQGIHVRAASRATVVEEMPEAYKDVMEVVNVVHGAGIARKVARHRPLAVVKG